MSTLFVDNVKPNLESGVHIPGHVVQIVTNVPTSVGLITQSSVTPPTMAEPSTVFRTGITPRFANSKLMLELNFLYGGNNNSAIGQFKFFDVTNNTNVQTITGPGSRNFTHASSRQVHSDANDRDTIHMKTVIDANNTVFREYTMYAAKESAQTHYFNATVTNNSGCSFAPFCFTITEIAQ